MTTLDLERPAEIPERNAVATLRQHIIDQIVQRRPVSGTPLMSAEGMAEHFGVSRSTMNRVLKDLQHDGWIDRRVGYGTFVGYRAELAPVAPPVQTKVQSPHRILRLAVAVLPLDESSNNWHAQGLLSGIDAVAADGGVSVELLGQCGDNNRFAKRLAQSQPDALIVLKPVVRSASALYAAERLNIPCVLTGTRLRDMGLPTVFEDGENAAAQTVKYLFDRGHRRIGFIVPDEPEQLWFDRRRGYVRGMREAGLAVDQNLIMWNMAGHSSMLEESALEGYLKMARPTAVILATGGFVPAFAQLMASGRLRMPEDLSLVAFDQTVSSYASMLSGLVVNYVELPLRQMAAKAVELARQLAMGQQVPTLTALPCRIVEGQTVRTIG